MGEFIVKLLAEVFQGIVGNLWPPGAPEAWSQNRAVILGAAILTLGALLVIYLFS